MRRKNYLDRLKKYQNTDIYGRRKDNLKIRPEPPISELDRELYKEDREKKYGL